MKTTRRAVIAALLTAPVGVWSQTKLETQDSFVPSLEITLRDGFQLIVVRGKDKVTLSAAEIWDALNPKLIEASSNAG